MSSPTNPNMSADLPPIGLRRVVYLQANRAPTVLDSKYRDGSYYEFNTEWRDLSTTPPQVWKLAAINSRTDAIWFLLGPGGGPSPAALQFTPTTGSVVYPNATTGNVNVSAGAGITVTGTPETLTIALAGGGTAIDEIAVQAATLPGVTPVDADATGLMTVNGAVVAAHSVPIETHTRALNAYNVEVQRTATSASTDATSQGLSSFNSTQFTADANGWVNLAGGSTAPILGIVVDANTAPGTPTVIPASGNITVTGAQVAASTVGANVIRSDSLAANTYTMEIQQSGSAAAKDTTKNGVAHFDSDNFSNDQGFVSLSAGVTVSSFLAFLNATVNNVTGDGTFYTIVLNSTSFNVGSNFDTGTGKYTAPVSGKYFFTATVPILNVGAAHDKGRWSIVIENNAGVTQQSYEYCQVSPAAVRNADTNCCFSGSLVVSMAATDRAYIGIQVYSSTKTINVGGSAAITSSPYATLSGYLIS